MADAKVNTRIYTRGDRHAATDDDATDDDATANDAAGYPTTSPYSILPTDEDRETIINDALDELADIARENILEFKREDFDTEEVVGQWIDSYLCRFFAEFAVIEPMRSDFSTSTAAEADALNEVLDAYIRELYDEIAERFYDEIAPLRAEAATDADTDADAAHAATMTEKIRILQKKPQPEQRTPEWYARRNNLITASAASKAFGTQASINQLIYEKCKNYDSASASAGAGASAGDVGNEPAQAPTTTGFALQGPVNSPLHWGQRYEPVTVMVYEHRNKTKLGEFGCIQHDKYPFIGASPDGINIDPDSPIYGRMVEIKNIFNREITGHPKEEYWIQTQLQMEVCDLDECDFVETRFKEFESEEEFLAAHGNEKGRILWFQSAPALTQYGNIAIPIQLYEYAPIGISEEEYEKWEAAVFAKHERERNIWVRTIYWRLDEYSCVLVRRNRLWFEEAVKVLESVWRTIEHERKTGYDHRAPMKRKSPPSSNTGGSGGGGGDDPVYKIIKLDTAILPETNDGTTGCEATATNMASLMTMAAMTTATAPSNARAGYKKYAGAAPGAPKRPNDVLISCFKIDDLEMDENKQ
jgi:putative phage-type endonuclease